MARAAREARASSRDVARRAGVSRATVSYVLNDRPDKTISAATRRRVLAAARELDYVPRAAAATLSAGRSRIVVLLEDARVPAEGEAVLALGSLGGVVRDALAREVSGWGMTLLSCGGDTSMTELLAHVDPVLVVAPNGLEAGDAAAVTSTGGLLVDRDDDGEPLSDFVATRAPRRQVDHLVARGHRRLAHLSTEAQIVKGLADRRRAAVRRACSDHGLDAPVEHAVAAGALGADRVEETSWILRGWTAHGVTAVACFNDIHAALALAAARRAGLTVPDDLAVIGIDDDPAAALTSPPLTTIGFDMVAFASRIAARGRALLDGEPAPAPPDPASLVRLVERAST